MVAVLPSSYSLQCPERRYYQHYALLVVAIWLLLQSSISQEDVNVAERLLAHFRFKLSLLYGTTNYSKMLMHVNVYHIPYAFHNELAKHYFLKL